MSDTATRCPYCAGTRFMHDSCDFCGAQMEPGYVGKRHPLDEARLDWNRKTYAHLCDPDNLEKYVAAQEAWTVYRTLARDSSDEVSL